MPHFFSGTATTRSRAFDAVDPSDISLSVVPVEGTGRGPGNARLKKDIVELIDFVKGYFASPKHVGALTPSSRGLAERITDAACVGEADAVIEFGPGTGAFTEVISRRIRSGAKFFAMEINEEFVHACQERCPGVKIFHDSAANARRYMDEMGLEYCDCIVSGLPFANFENDLQDNLLDTAYGLLRPGGIFVTFTYFFSPYMPRGRRFRRRLEGRFSKVEKTGIVWSNVPPAFAYRAIK